MLLFLNYEKAGAAQDAAGEATCWRGRMGAGGSQSSRNMGPPDRLWDAEKTAGLSSSPHWNCLNGFMFSRMTRYYLWCWSGSPRRWPACVACFLPSSHVGIKVDPAFEADILDLSMQNIAMLLFWWLASNLELAYPSEVYCNLSLMIGVPVIDGGLQAAPPPPDSLVLFSPLLEKESESLKCALTISAVRKH